MKLTIAGAGHAGLVTGACLAEIGHEVTCFDIDKNRIELLEKGISPIYEAGLEELIRKNQTEGRLFFTTEPEEAYRDPDGIMIAVGTPAYPDGSPNVSFVENAVRTMAEFIHKNAIVITKSTVPPGTNQWIEELLNEKMPGGTKVKTVSNPEFLREGSGVHDTFHGDRIIIGSDDLDAGKFTESIYQRLNIPILRTSRKSAELIKYASNTFLAAKISFINELAVLCEASGADIQEVALGMGMDTRIGTGFLNAGIGFGGPCLPKDTAALLDYSRKAGYGFKMLEALAEVNFAMRKSMLEKARELLGNYSNRKIAVLGISFKPDTDDIRDSPALAIINELLIEAAIVTVYDPKALSHAKRIYGNAVVYSESISDAVTGADAAFIVTDWAEIRTFPPALFYEKMNKAVIFDGRNCYSLDDAEASGITYISIGRRKIMGVQGDGGR